MPEFEWFKKGRETEAVELADKLDVHELNIELKKKNQEKEEAIKQNYDDLAIRAETLGKIQKEIDTLEEKLGQYNH